MGIVSLRVVVPSLDLTSPLQDATTNPSLILAAAGKAGYARLIDAAVSYAKEKGGDINTQVENATDRLVSEADGIAGRTWLGTDVIGVGFFDSLLSSARRFWPSFLAVSPLRSMPGSRLIRRLPRPRFVCYPYFPFRPTFYMERSSM